MRERFFKNTRRLVVKIGTSDLESSGDLSNKAVERLAKDLAAVRSRNPKLEVILVSSGAIACGMKLMGLRKRPAEVSKLQALAAAGQPLLMQMYTQAFRAEGVKVAQILLTWEDLGSRKRFENTRRTLAEILAYGALPVVNENDTVATEEIQFGDNDQLSAMVAMMVGADLLIILSDANGFYADVRAGEASRIPVVDDLDASIFDAVKDSRKDFSKGGMTSKLKAVAKATSSGIPCVVAGGKEKRVLSRLFSGEDLGTVFLPKFRKASTKKRWIAYISKPEGSLTVDDGAEVAICKRGKSLLAKGIVDMKGHFKAGDAVSVENRASRVLGKGIINFSSAELEKIKGLDSNRWSGVLGRPCMDEVMHRDNFVPV